MKYIGYILLLLSGFAGYSRVRVWFVVLLAFLSVILFMSARRKNLKETPQAPDQNMLMDGAYLFLRRADIKTMTERKASKTTNQTRTRE